MFNKGERQMRKVIGAILFTVALIFTASGCSTSVEVKRQSKCECDKCDCCKACPGKPCCDEKCEK